MLQSEKLGVPLMCGLLERYNPGILTAMSLLEEPLHVTAQRHSPYVARIRSGVATDLLIHDADIAVRMMGAEPVLVRGSFGYLHPDSDPGSEDVAEALLTFGTGAIADLSASRMSQRKVRSFAVSELNRLVEVDMLRNTVTLYHHVVDEKPRAGHDLQAADDHRDPAAGERAGAAGRPAGPFRRPGPGDDADADAERAGILPSHRVVDAVRQAARTPGG